MNALYTGIYSKTSGSSLSTAVGGRIYADRAPDSPSYPYVVFMLPTVGQMDTFKNDIDDVTLQFSIYHNTNSPLAIGTIYGYLRSLFDDVVLTVSGYTNVMTVFQNLATMIVDIVTSTGTETVKHWAIDYNLINEAA